MERGKDNLSDQRHLENMERETGLASTVRLRRTPPLESNQTLWGSLAIDAVA
jgi:hypothetical protein